MNQDSLVRAYIEEFGSIIPAKMGGRIYRGYMFGSETPRVCRRMFAKGELIRTKAGKFKEFTFKPKVVLPPAYKPVEVKVEDYNLKLI